MSIFALQSPAGGFLDEDMQRFNKIFDDWCVQFDNYEDANMIAESFDERTSIEIVAITPLSYPKYFFHKTLFSNGDFSKSRVSISCLIIFRRIFLK